MLTKACSRHEEEEFIERIRDAAQASDQTPIGLHRGFVGIYRDFTGDVYTYTHGYVYGYMGLYGENCFFCLMQMVAIAIL